MREGGEAVEERAEIGGVESGLGGLVAELNFEEDGQGHGAFGCGFVEALGEAERVDGVDGVEEGGCFGGLVGLQVADEVNLGAGDVEFGELGALRFEFLYAVLAEEGDAGGNGFGDGFDGMQLGDGHEADVAAAAPASAAGGSDAILDGSEPF